MNKKLTLKEANEISKEWFSMSPDVDRNYLAKWERERWRRLPANYLSVCGDHAAIICKGLPLSVSVPIDEAIKTALERGIQTEIAWNGTSGIGEWVSLK